VGLWNGLRAVPKPTGTVQSEFGLPGESSLAGGYMRLASRGAK